jgi:hypothetical protein
MVRGIWRKYLLCCTAEANRYEYVSQKVFMAKSRTKQYKHYHNTSWSHKSICHNRGYAFLCSMVPWRPPSGLRSKSSLICEDGVPV